MDGWIVVRGWEEFQHYRDRRPLWIKVYTSLLDNDEYRHLSGHCRSVLLGIWLAYATSDSRLRLDTLSLSRRLGLRVTTADIEALVQAGFLRVRASKPLARRYQDASPRARPRARGEGEKEKEKDLLPGKPPGSSKPWEAELSPGEAWRELELVKLLELLEDADAKTLPVLRKVSEGLTQAQIVKVRESVVRNGKRYASYAVAALKSEKGAE